MAASPLPPPLAYPQVLMAAREPLSLSMLNALDLLRGCRLLPGWKVLFFERDYQVLPCCHGEGGGACNQVTCNQSPVINHL